MRNYLLSLAALAGFGLATQAQAVTLTEAQGNLASFSYSVNDATRTIDIYETWGTQTSYDVRILVEGWDYSLSSWTINKYVTNETGRDWTWFTHELLEADGSSSHNRDGLSFAQYGRPHVDRESNPFTEVTVDELTTRDYLHFTGGTLANGQTASFTYGIANRRDTEDTNPFYIRQLQSPAGFVPEPGTWMMMIAGFGMVGMAVRLRRSTLSVMNS